ncbi:hypothetical protein ACFX1Z_037535 [Malus domestica]
MSSSASGCATSQTPSTTWRSCWTSGIPLFSKSRFKNSSSESPRRYGFAYSTPSFVSVKSAASVNAVRSPLN